MSNKLDLVNKSRTLDISVSRSHFDFEVDAISFENMVNTRTKRADLFIVCCRSATDVQADLQTNCRSSAECL